ncbi:MAG: hypothetical protein C0417_03245 [Chlorobiaceae bacterium]|nr:hypothetical protein [Chlorobiaceae bacterium]
MPIKRLKDLFSPPSFPDEEQSRIAYIVHYILLLLFFFLVIPIIYNWTDGQIFNTIILLGEELIIIAAFYFNMRGEVKTSAILLTFSMPFMTTFLLVAEGDGIHDVDLLIFPAAIALAGLLLNRFSFYIYIGITLICVCSIYLLEMNGIFTTQLSSFVSYRDLTDIMIIIIITSFIIDLLVKKIRSSIKELRQNQGELKSKNEELAKHQELLKRSADGLRVAALRWQSTFDAVHDPIFLMSMDHKILLANKATQECFNITPEAAIGKHCWEVVHNQNNPFPECPVLQLEKTGKRESIELKVSSNWYEIIVDPVFDEDHKLVGIVHIARNITKRKHYEEAVATEKERLDVTLRSIGDGVISTDRIGKILIMNKLAEEYTGWNFEETDTKNIRDIFKIIDGETRNPIDNPVNVVVEKGTIVETKNHTILISRDGGERRIEINVAPIRNRLSDITGTVLVFRDISEKHRLEEKLHTAQKLESIGVLAAGIAHDFNNLLNGIFGYIELAMNRMSDHDKALSYLRKAIGVFERAQDLTRQLFTFAKGSRPIKKNLSLEPIIKNNITSVFKDSGVNTNFITPTELWLCEIDEVQINQALKNILLNALQSMSDRGSIEINAINCPKMSPVPGQLCERNYVCITVEDHGQGISQENITRIFDPFFTTKQKGIGLGLSIAYSIIKKHDGYVDVKSEIGKGTTVRIFLPAFTKELHPQIVPQYTPVKDSGKILLMDDESYIIDLGSEMIEILGFKVETVRSGCEAVDIFRKAYGSDDPFQLVILDLTIPYGMGGKDALIKLREIDPYIKAIASSGYSDDPVMADPFSFGFNGSLAKPYRKVDLARAISNLLR